MSSMSELYTLLSGSVQRAASTAAYKWHGLLGAEDIEQELWVEILESPATTEKLEGSDADLVTDLLARMADRICIKERDTYEHFSGQFRYSVNEVKTVIEAFFLRSGEELLIDLVDAEVAFDLLTETNPNYADAIFRRYALGETPGSDKPFEDALRRGLTKLTDLMNRNFKDREREHRDGPGTRIPMARGYDSYEGN